MPLQGFEKAQSDNLPVVDFGMIHDFYVENMNYVSSEISGSKNIRAMRDVYALEAVGFVQLRRNGNLCTVKAQVTPEHRITSKSYNVSVTVNEVANTIIECMCEDCPASEGGCKHALAFVGWLHKKSTEPSVTEAISYWKKSSLSTAIHNDEAYAVGPLGKKTVQFQKDIAIYDQLAGACDMATKEKYFKFSSDVTFAGPMAYSIHRICTFYKEYSRNYTADNLLQYLKNFATSYSTKELEKATRGQSTTPLWHEMRYARITASKFHEASHCSTDGSLVESILGSKNFIQTMAMKRGLELEEKVRDVIAKKLKIKIKTRGLFINADFIIFGASPDGLTEDFVIEIKCPSKDVAVNYYLDSNNKPTKKFYGQMQLQMLLCDKKKALFCVALPNFEITKEVKVVEVIFNEEYCMQNIEKCMLFWKRYIFPHV